MTTSDAIAAELNKTHETLRDVRTHVRTHAAQEDPHVILRVGQLRARLHAAEALLTRSIRSDHLLLEAQAFVSDVANEVASQAARWGVDSPQRVQDFETDRVYQRIGASYLNTPLPGAPPAESAPARVQHPTVLRSAVRIIASDTEAIDVARDVAARLSATASGRDKERTVPTAELDELSRNGLFGITVPRAFGGAEVSTETLITVFQILSAADPAIGQLPQNHFVFVDAVRQDGSPEQQAFFFQQLLQGARLGNAQAERGGSSALDLKTRLLRADDGEYRLNGIKYYCTGAITAHWIPVAALDDQQRQVLAYVPRNAPGVELLTDWRGMGQRVTYSGTARFKDVRVPTEHVVEHWKLFARPNLFHAFGALIHAAIDIGIAQNALEDTAVALRRRARPRLGAAVQKALDDPHAVRRVGELLTLYHAAEALVLDAAQRMDAAGDALDADTIADISIAVSESKALAEDAAIAVSNEMFALLGSSATDEDLNLHRHWRNARTHTVHDANQWRYHHAGNYFLNGVIPGLPIRRLTA